ncbi:uncharacterized protein LOC123905952 [Trifolium pratense]|uniref:uncharacterized protein LOC123905952 n=1 Tax=Trifolium pratense TaxID=57577 RepID=UPI001E69164E|nr:uncharacterized protein LOC123905952 [Trifolium pratense]
MDSSTVQVPASKTTSFWTDEKHVNYLNTMEASFVRTMFENKNYYSSSSSNLNRQITRIDHHGQILRLDRNLPDSSESTLDLKPHKRRRTRKYHAPSDLMGPKTRRTRRRTSQPFNSSHDQVVPQIENESKGAAYNGESDKGAEN